MDTVCEIWRASLDDLPPGAAAWASDWERARAGRFRTPDDATRSLLGAVLLRAVVGRHLGVAPGAVVVDRTCTRCGEPHGRPTVAGGPSLSVSHSGDLVVVAVAPARAPVGVDVEAVVDTDLSDVVTAAFSPPDRLELTSARDVLVGWTRKEAYLKATGEGLAATLADVRVSPARRPAALVERTDAPAVACAMADLGPWPDHVGTVAVLGVTAVDVRQLDAAPLLAGG